jgi:hypothetical protein
MRNKQFGLSCEKDEQIAVSNIPLYFHSCAPPLGGMQNEPESFFPTQHALTDK